MTEGNWLPTLDPPERPVRRWIGRWHLVLLMAAAILTLFEAAIFVSSDLWPGLAFNLVGAGLLILGRILIRADDRFETLAIRPEDAPMLPELNEPTGVLVSLWVLQGHAITGHDRGAMWVEDGRLVFCGRRMSFVLAQNVVERDPPTRKPGPGTLALTLRHPTAVGPLAVSFTPLFGDRPYTVPLDLVVAEWLDSKPSSGTTQLPPTTLGPGAVGPRTARLRLLRKTAIETSFFGIVFLPVAIAFHLFPLLAGLLLIGAVLVLVLPRTAPKLAMRDAEALGSE